ncbi:MAG: APC family permease [Oscillospiraceae bacterium]|nr:APC family permease [Oscillospiraceae bacterium]
MPEKTKKFKLFDAVLAAVCVVLVVESASPAAAIGNSQFFWWIFLLIGFFLPYGMISSELGTTYDDEGGIYDWVKRAFGKSWGTRVSWYYYINFPLWMASLAVLFTDIIMQISGISLSSPVAIIIQLIFIWAVVFISSFKISDSKWILNLAAIIKAFIMVSIGVLGIYVAITRGSANEFTPSSFIPSFGAGGLSYISIIIFNFLGFEVVTTFASEMKDPGREIPRAIVLGGLLIALFYLLSAFGIGVAVPTEQLSASGGLIDSFMLLLGTDGGILITLFGILFLYTLFSNLISWSLGVNYVAQYAAENGSLPKFFAKKSKNDMPQGANLANGAIASVIVLISPLIPSPDIFWSFFALNMVTLLMSYILMFPAFLKLRKKDPDVERPYKVSGGRTRLAIMTYLPMILLIVSVVFSIMPLDSSEGELMAKIPLLIGTAAAVAIGELLVFREKTRH